MSFRGTSVLVILACFVQSSPGQDLAMDSPSQEQIVRFENAYAAAGSRLWANAEYLLWWTKDMPEPVPLLTDGTLVGDPAGNTLLGGEELGLGIRSGARFTLGSWLDARQLWGVEASGFFLGRDSDTQSVGSDASGSPLLTIPFVDAQAGAESVTFVSVPGVFSGSAVLDASSQLYGMEANLLRNLGGPRGAFHLLAGFRYLNLRESLDLFTDADLISPLQGTGDTYDSFLTMNEFYGVQIGAMIERTRGLIFVRATTKVALGAMQETLRVRGYQTASPGNDFGVPVFFPAGYFANPTNNGSFTTQRLAVVPQVDLTIGMQLTRRWHATVGYSFLFLSSVVRPGDQIDRTINGSQNPSISGGTTLDGPARPAPRSDPSTYWAQGINFGLEYLW